MSAMEFMTQKDVDEIMNILDNWEEPSPCESPSKAPSKALCEARYEAPSSISIRSSANKSVYKCPWCFKYSENIFVWHRHIQMELSKNKARFCPLCFIVCSGRKKLNAHISRCMRAEVIGEYKCNYCSKIFFTNRNRNRHMRNVCIEKFFKMVEDDGSDLFTESQQQQLDKVKTILI